MRKMLIFAAAALATAGSAHAELYTGLEGQLNTIDWANGGSDKAGHTGGLALRLGYRSGRFAVEIGGETSANDYGDTSSGGTHYISHVTMNTVAADGFAYFPLNQDGWFQPFVTAGFGYTKMKDRTVAKWDTDEIKDGSVTATNPTGESVTIHHKLVTSLYSGGDVMWRAGAGIEVRLSKDFSTRLTVRYQPYDFAGLAQRGATFNFGVLMRL